MAEERSGCFKVKDYLVAPELFTKGFHASGGPCTCRATCCEGGVFADVRERDRIMAHRETIKKYMDETQTTDESRWFDAQDREDADFASGRCIGTSEINDKCAFLDRLGRCSLQVAAAGEGMPRWALKPLFCVLFPISISDHVIEFDDMLQGDEACCSVESGHEIPLFKGCRDELVHLLGEDGYRLIEEHYELKKQDAASAPGQPIEKGLYNEYV